MSIYKYPHPNGETYSIGTMDWEFKHNNIFTTVLDYSLYALRKVYPIIGVPLTMITGAVVGGDGAWCPTYGLWAGPGWAGGT